MKKEIRLGIIAGSGEIPEYICRKAKKEGAACFVAGVGNKFSQQIKKQADLFESFEVKDFLNLLSWFKDHRVSKVVLAGKVKHRIIYSRADFPLPLSFLLEGTKNRNPDEILRAVFDYIENLGIEVMDPSGFLSDLFCEPGVLTRNPVSAEINDEIKYGWSIARKMADLEVGQTVVIKNKAVVAVEGMEGTDQTIIRAGSIAGKGCVVLKAARTHQDARIDQPAVGLRTIKSLKRARCSALCIEAGKVLFLNKQKALNLAEENNISIIAKN